MSDVLIDTLDLIALLRKAITSGLAADSAAREAVAAMSDEDVVAYARDLYAETETKADAFIDRLEGETEPE